MNEPKTIGVCSLCNGKVVKESFAVWCSSCGAAPKHSIIEMDPTTQFGMYPQLLNEKNLDDQCE